MEYGEFGPERLKEVMDIYREAGWMAYLQDDAKLRRAFEHSLCILGAFEGDVLVAFVRCVGDGEHVLLIQDLIVREAYRRRGVGAELMRRILDRYSGVRMRALLTDAQDERANRFYRAIGFTEVRESGITAYMK